MLLSLEPVKMFHQFIFLCFKQFKDISFGKLVRIVFNCFVDFLGLNTIKSGHIGVQNHLLVPTTIMNCFAENSKKPVLQLNGQDPEVAALFAKSSTIEEYVRVWLNEEFSGLLLVDEFQYVENVSTMLKLLSDKHENLKILCSGSSSLDIFQRVEESMAGRVRVIEVLSLSFAEYLLFKDPLLWHLQQNATTADEALMTPLLNAYREYLVYGGLPRVALAEKSTDKIALINDIYQTYLLNDVRKYIRNEHFVGFARLIRLLAAQIGNLVNVNELSRESGLKYATCESYIQLLQQMYIIRLLEPLANKRKTITQMKKVYFYDLGLRNMVYNSFNEIDFRTDKGAIFENEVMLELWRSRNAGESLLFYRTTNGTEVDFVMDGPTRKLLVECKFHHNSKNLKLPAMTNLAADLDNAAVRCYAANLNYYSEEPPVRMMPCYWCDRIQ